MATATNISRSSAWHGWRAGVFSFPDPVNEVSARLVAAGVVVLSLATILLGVPWLTAATLESAFGYCLGCNAFAALMRLGVVPTEVCERCNDIAAGARS